MQKDGRGLPGAADGAPGRRHHPLVTVTEHGLVLGAGTLLSKMGMMAFASMARKSAS